MGRLGLRVIDDSLVGTLLNGLRGFLGCFNLFFSLFDLFLEILFFVLAPINGFDRLSGWVVYGGVRLSPLRSVSLIKIVERRMGREEK